MFSSGNLNINSRSAACVFDSNACVGIAGIRIHRPMLQILMLLSLGNIETQSSGTDVPSLKARDGGGV